MGTLKDMLAYIDERHARVAGVEARLLALQGKYENHFAEINRVREAEFGQLREAIAGDRGLPPGFRARLDAALARAGAAFDAELKAVDEQRAARRTGAEAVRVESEEAERAVRARNAELDREEEGLKARVEELRSRVAGFNARIRSLGRGFGFFSQLGRMGALRREREVLDREQVDLAARLEALRRRWVEEEKTFTDAEQQRQQQWLELSTEGAALATKIETLQETRAAIAERTALEEVLFAEAPEPLAPAQGDPACSRCQQPNPAGAAFCRACALRLSPDRPDAVGSLAEIGELNWHHKRFAEGMAACQEIIALLRGLKSGLEAFRKSVADVYATQKKYSLKKLQLDVPERSQAFGKRFDELEQELQIDCALLPREFAARVSELLKKVFTEPHIKGYFEGMGQELSRQAKAQW